MSGGPVLTGGENCIKSTQKQYINLSLKTKDWCGYSGHCRTDQLLTDHVFTCLLCKHRTPLDVPEILEVMHNERNKNNRST